ncbi:hypothetical protein DFH08DRAFT_813854 [Mycena albidolilacea]|uniref:Uncharacterized protein n=1 Tax=Mycena albidolilacea TaxID=1033008 RepID=A0AAD6ZQW9_9AGAR|nr:hypothetical protein DFH08DRAFT_813854 [Mycena albidolilacea]
MWLMGELKYGKYADISPKELHPKVLENYGQSNDLNETIANDQDHHIRHKAIEVIETQCPFRSKKRQNVFVTALQEVQATGIIPDGLGVAKKKNGEGLIMVVAWAQALEVIIRIQAAEDN